MSHFTFIETSLRNVFYLEKTLEKLGIVYKKTQVVDSNSLTINNFVLPQPNGHDIEFSWNGQNYDLAIDLDFWDKSKSIQKMKQKIVQEYSTISVVGESQNHGYKVAESKTNHVDGSRVITMQRYSI